MQPCNECPGHERSIGETKEFDQTPAAERALFVPMWWNRSQGGTSGGGPKGDSSTGDQNEQVEVAGSRIPCPPTWALTAL